MEANDDWCYFKKLGKKKLSENITEKLSSKLIAVCDLFGYVLIGYENKVALVMSRHLAEFFSTENNRDAVVSEFPFEIEMLSVSTTGVLAAVAGSHFVSIRRAKLLNEGKNEGIDISIVHKIVNIEWLDKALGVLNDTEVLELYNETGQRINQLDKVKCMTACNGDILTFTETNLQLHDSQTMRIKKQQSVDEFVPFAMKTTCTEAFLYGVTCNYLVFKVFELDTLNCISTLSDSDFIAYKTPPALHSTLSEYSLSGYIDYIPSRKTVVFSSTASPEIETIFYFQDDYQLTCWDERSAERCKFPWELGGGYEHLCRGMGLVTSVPATTDKITFPVKDYELELKFPPVILTYGSDGVVYYYQFVDLRGEFLEDSARTDPLLFTDIENEKDQLSPIQNAVKQYEEEQKKSEPKYQLFGKSVAPVKEEQKKEELPAQLEAQPEESSPAKIEKNKIVGFITTSINEMSEKLGSIQKNLEILDKNNQELTRTFESTKNQLSGSLSGLVPLAPKVDLLKKSHIQSQQDVENLGISAKFISAELSSTEEIARAGLDPKLLQAKETLERTAKELTVFVELGLERILDSLRKQREELGISHNKTMYNPFKVTRGYVPPSKQREGTHLLSEERISSILHRKINDLYEIVSGLEISIAEYTGKLRKHQEKRFAFDDIEAIDLPVSDSVIDYEDLEIIENRFRGFFTPHKVSCQVPSKIPRELPSKHPPLSSMRKLKAPAIGMETVKFSPPEQPQTESSRKVTETIKNIKTIEKGDSVQVINEENKKEEQEEDTVLELRSLPTFQLDNSKPLVAALSDKTPPPVTTSINPSTAVTKELFSAQPSILGTPQTGTIFNPIHTTSPPPAASGTGFFVSGQRNTAAIIQPLVPLTTQSLGLTTTQPFTQTAAQPFLQTAAQPFPQTTTQSPGLTAAQPFLQTTTQSLGLTTTQPFGLGTTQPFALPTNPMPAGFPQMATPFALSTQSFQPQQPSSFFVNAQPTTQQSLLSLANSGNTQPFSMTSLFSQSGFAAPSLPTLPQQPIAFGNAPAQGFGQVPSVTQFSNPAPSTTLSNPFFQTR